MLTELVAAAVPDLLAAIGSGTDDALVAEVQAAIDPVRLDAGETLFAVGDEADAVYLVVAGRLLVVLEDESGEPRVIRRLGGGEIVGEIGLLQAGRRTATITADRDTTLARLTKGAFERIADTHPAFLRGVTRTVVSRLAHPRPPVDIVSTIALAVAHPDLDGGVLCRGVRAALLGGDSVEHLSAETVTAAVGEGADSLAVERYLDEVEASHRFTILEADDHTSDWSRAALRRADRVLIVVRAEDPVQSELAAAASGGHRPDIWLAIARSGNGSLPSRSAELAKAYGADRVLHFRPEVEGDVGRIARLVTGTGTALVLGGGGARGFAHIGIYRALLELGVPVDAVAGSSIGGIIGAAIATSPSPDELTAMVKSGFSQVLDYTLPLVSMVKGSKITREIDRIFAGVDIEDLPLPFLCVSTNLTTAEEMVHDSGAVTLATRAGLAIPGVIPPVPRDGDLLVDAGVLNNLPIGPMRATGMVNTVIAVDVAPQRGPRAREDYGLSVSGWKALGTKLGRKRVYPGISAVLLRSMIVGSMKQRDDLLAAGMVDLYLDPDLRGISLLAFDKVEPVAKAGYEAGYPMIEAWLKERANATLS